MRSIRLRGEVPPDDATVVVRGGLLTATSVQMTDAMKERGLRSPGVRVE